MESLTSRAWFINRADLQERCVKLSDVSDLFTLRYHVVQGGHCDEYKDSGIRARSVTQDPKQASPPLAFIFSELRNPFAKLYLLVSSSIALQPAQGKGHEQQDKLNMA